MKRHPMIIFVSDARAAELAVGQIFGDSITKGPRMRAPTVLLREIAEDPVFNTPQAVVLAPRQRIVVLESPPRANADPARLVRVVLHRVQIQCGGDVYGWALRCSDQDLRAIKRWVLENS